MICDKGTFWILAGVALIILAIMGPLAAIIIMAG